MRTFAQQPKASQYTTSSKPSKPSRPFFGQSRDVSSFFHLQSKIGNQAVQRLLTSSAEELQAISAIKASMLYGHDFSRIPAHASVQRSIQPKFKVGSPGDKYEQEADHVADLVVEAKPPEVDSSRKAGSYLALQNLENQIQRGSSLGKSLDTSTNKEMSREIGYDFSGVGCTYRRTSGQFEQTVKRQGLYLRL